MAEDARFIVRYATLAALTEAQHRELRHGGGFVVSERVPAAFSRVAVDFCLPEGPTVEVHGTVVNQRPGGFFVQFDKGIEYEALQSAVAFVIELSSTTLAVPDVGARLSGSAPRARAPRTVPTPGVTSGARVRPAAVETRPETGAQASGTPTSQAASGARARRPSGIREVTEARSDDPRRSGVRTKSARSGESADGVGKPAWELVDLGSEVPLHKQVADLTTQDKIKLARHATKPVRALLIRDTEHRIHIEIVKNPKASLQELGDYAGLNISPQALRWLASQKRLVREKRVLIRLILNKKTPADVALRLLNLVTPPDQLRLYRTPRLLDVIKTELRRRLMARGEI